MGSIYASQARRKDMGREVRDLAVASSSGGSKLWRQRQALEAAASSGRDCELWRRQQGPETAASSGDGSKLWRRQ